MTDGANNDLNTTLSALVEGWCDRRDLRALATLLPAYLSNNGLTDGWGDILAALRRLRYGHELPDEELDVVHRLVVEVESIVHRR